MIVLGADTHKRSHTVAAVAAGTGELRGERTVPVGRRGFGALLQWARGLDEDRVWALEDCRHVSGSLERFLIERGERVLRIPTHLTATARMSARQRGKSDPIDALNVARAALPRYGRPRDDEPVFGEWSASDWDNWHERNFRPAAIEVGLPADTSPRDLRGSFASLPIFEGLNVLEVAPELGHKPSTCLDIYGRLFEEFDPARRRPAVYVIREEREAVGDRVVPSGYPAGGRNDDEADGATAKGGR